MGYYNFLGVLEIIKDSIKIFPKNGKIMASIATVGVLLYSSTILFYSFIYKPIRFSIDAKNQGLALDNVTNSQAKNTLRGVLVNELILLIVTLGYLLFCVLVARAINLSTIYVSAMSFNGHEVSFKNVSVRVKRSFKRGPISSGLTNKTKWCYLFIFVITILMNLTIFVGVPFVFIKSALIVIMVPTSVYILYISVFSVLAYVILAIEEKCDEGEALKKAERLITTKKADGFILISAYNLLILILFLVYKVIVAKWPRDELVVGVFLLCITYLVTMFVLIAYTCLYFKCKESHGEEIELGDQLEYSESATSLLLDENIP